MLHNMSKEKRDTVAFIIMYKEYAIIHKNVYAEYDMGL